MLDNGNPFPSLCIFPAPCVPCCSAESGHETITYRDPQDHRIFEQSLTDIWQAICLSSQDVLRSSGIKGEEVKGVGFDATCSLAVVNQQGRPVEVSMGKDLGLVKEQQEVGKDHSCILWAGELMLLGLRGDKQASSKGTWPSSTDMFSSVPLQ